MHDLSPEADEKQSVRTNILVELSMTEASARHMLVAISDVREVWSSIIKPSKKKLHPMPQERLGYSN